MPEGPEVSILAKQLNDILTGCAIAEITIEGNKAMALQKSVGRIASELAFPLTVKGVRKKGKFLYFWLMDVFGNDLFLGNSLGLSGRWATQPNKYSVANFKMTKCSGLSNIYYNDKRHFGKFMLFPSLDALEAKLNGLGGDILGEVKELAPVLTRPGALGVAEGDVARVSMLRRAQEKFPGKQIVNILMDQKVISGVGNYLKAEGLYASRIYPGDKIGKIDGKALEDLFSNLKRIAKDSYDDYGVSTQDFLDVYDKAGKFSLKVYKRGKDPEGNEVKAKKFSDQRTTYFVPSLQKN